MTTGFFKSPVVASYGAKVALFLITGLTAIAAMEASPGSPLAGFWPVNGVALAALLRLEPRVQGRWAQWVAIGAAIFLADRICGLGWTASALFTFANLVEIALAYFILRTRLGRISTQRGPFASMLPCMLGAAVIAPAISAMIVLGGASFTPSIGDVDVLRQWWLPDFLGVLIVVPLALSVTRQDLAELTTPKGAREALIGAAILAALIASIALFRMLAPIFLIAPLILLAGVRFRALGVAVTIAAAAWCIIPLAGAGEIMGNSVVREAGDRITAVQAFLAMNALLALGVSALLEERAAFPRVLEAREAAAAEAAQARLRLLMNVAHEIRTPLNVIQGCSEMVDGAGPVTPEQRELLGAITASSKQLQALAGDLLETARLQFGAPPFSPEQVRPQAPIEAAIADVRAAQGWDGPVQVAIRCETVWADPQRFRQVATNLISNAAKFGGAYGPVRIDIHDLDQSTVLTVSDCGPGLPPGREHEVFEPFAVNAGQITSASAGVGLSLVKQLVEAHGGKVRCVSAPYIQTRFDAEFPLESSAAAQAARRDDMDSGDPDSVF